MSSTIPAGGISLRGPAEDVGELKPETSSAILLKLREDVLHDLKSTSKDELRFVTGNTPKLRIGGRTIDLSISPDAFRNELYASTTGASTTDLTFTTIVSHRAEPKSTKQYGGGTAGTDTALAALQNSLATYKQEKEANQTTITNQMLDVPKNRFDAARKEKLDRKRRLLESWKGSQPPSPSLSDMGTPTLGAAPTSMPLSEDEVRWKAMRKPLVHLLAIGPTTKEEMRSKTHIPKDDLELILQKVGKQVDGNWQLAERAYKELDVWSFAYPSQSDRQSTIDNAIRAYDRLRLGKDDNLWQLLLRKEERGKGRVLSRLHFNGGLGGGGNSLTPHYQPSPAPHVNSAADEKVASSVNTPRLGSSTPRPPSSKGDVMKRLLSKNPEKAHRIEEAKMKKTKAAEEARAKKRKEKEEAASDKEGKRPAKKQATAKKANPKIKSADIVHSSDDESGEDGEVKEKPTTQPKTAAPTKKKAAAASSTSPEESSDSAKPVKEVKKTATKVKPSQTTAKTSASHAVKATRPGAAATAGKNTPQPTNGLSAPSSQHKARSPSAVGSRPGVPSPLGAARPRVASDVSDRSAVGVQRMRQGADTPRGLGITNGVRKRTDTITGKGTATPSGGEAKPKERTTSEKSQKPAVSGTGTPKINGATTKPETGVKRKASDPPAQAQQESKHRKTESSSSLTLSASATNSSTTSNLTAQTSHTVQTSPDASASSSDTSTVLDTISYKTGVQQASKFKEQFYPAYNLLYDEIEGAQRRGENVGREKVETLRKMHERLVEMKKEIEAASRREHGEE